MEIVQQGRHPGYPFTGAWVPGGPGGGQEAAGHRPGASAGEQDRVSPGFVSGVSGLSEPPSCNTGVRLDHPDLSRVLRFDAYGATFDDDAMGVVHRLQRAIPSLQAKLAKGMHSYPFGVELTDFHDKAFVWYRHSGVTECHVAAQGELSHPVVRVVRGEWPVHKVSRADVCVDFDASGFFDRMRDMLIDLARHHGVRTETAGDWIEAKHGRTLYVGARSSAVRIRVYEKGHQLRQSGVDPEASLDLVRVEVQVRPQKEQRSAAASASPEALFRGGTVSDAMASVLMEREGSRIRASAGWRRSQDEIALAFLLKQWGPLLKRLRADLGDWHAVGATLGLALEKEVAGV